MCNLIVVDYNEQARKHLYILMYILICAVRRSPDAMSEVLGNNNTRLLDRLIVTVTLCFTITRQRDVESHSQHCSTSSHDIPVTSSPFVAMGTDTLLVSVTRAPSTAATWAPFKVVTKVCTFP